MSKKATLLASRTISGVLPLASLVLATACARLLGDFSIGVDAGVPQERDAQQSAVGDGSGAAPESNGGDGSGADSSPSSRGGSGTGSVSGGGTASDSGSGASGTNGADGAGPGVGPVPSYGVGGEGGSANDGGDTARDSGIDATSSNGRDSGASAEAGATTGSGGDSGSSGGDSGACAPGATQCSGASAVQTCGASGQWGTAWQCTSGACGGGACKGSTAIGTSCRTSGPGLTDCGATGENCCTSLQVPGGIYYRSYYNDSTGAPIDEADPAIVSGFRLDKYLVTVGRFRQFVNAVSPPDGGTGWLPSAGSGKHTHVNGGSGLNATSGGYEAGWQATDDSSIVSPNNDLGCTLVGEFTTWTPAPSGNESLPMTCANWFDAYAFCIWDGGFLPSEAEWEYAAAGGSQELRFPWGATSPGTDNQYAIYGCNYMNPLALTGVSSVTSCVAAVGTATLGAGYWGQLDLVGETFVWNLDWYDAYANPCTDCVNVTPGSLRAERGGDATNNQSPLLSAARYARSPVADYGIRCARTP